MLSKNKIKYIQAISRKKGRAETGLFIAEGEKLITELKLSGFKFELLVTLEDRQNIFSELQCEKIVASADEIKKISLLTTPTSALALCFQQTQLPINQSDQNDLTIVLDNIQDPGNLGTIIRLASWFGIGQIICSENTVDCYNPKVIQATMGAIAHVKVNYTNLIDFLSDSTKNGKVIYGTFMEGENIYTAKLADNGIIVFGNEGNGISEELKKYINKNISIPSFAGTQHTVESLNVSVAAAIVCSEFRRRNIFFDQSM
jgi:TrmH family RNA methyltransferase